MLLCLFHVHVPRLPAQWRFLPPCRGRGRSSSDRIVPVSLPSLSSSSANVHGGWAGDGHVSPATSLLPCDGATARFLSLLCSRSTGGGGGGFSRAVVVPSLFSLLFTDGGAVSALRVLLRALFAAARRQWSPPTLAADSFLSAAVVVRATHISPLFILSPSTYRRKEKEIVRTKRISARIDELF